MPGGEQKAGSRATVPDRQGRDPLGHARREGERPTREGEEAVRRAGGFQGQPPDILEAGQPLAPEPPARLGLLSRQQVVVPFGELQMLHRLLVERHTVVEPAQVFEQVAQRDGIDHHRGRREEQPETLVGKSHEHGAQQRSPFEIEGQRRLLGPQLLPGALGSSRTGRPQVQLPPGDLDGLADHLQGQLHPRRAPKVRAQGLVPLHQAPHRRAGAGRLDRSGDPDDALGGALLFAPRGASAAAKAGILPPSPTSCLLSGSHSSNVIMSPRATRSLRWPTYSLRPWAARMLSISITSPRCQGKTVSRRR